jgi:hypothetical protein
MHETNEKVNTMTAEAKKWPNLYFIGGMRCGSTTLFLLLSQHPEIFMASIKEPMFWLAENLRRLGKDYKSVVTGKYVTTDAYLGLFETPKSSQWRGEASHYLYHPDVVGVLRQEVPDAHIIVSLRNPTDRLFSEYLIWVRSWGFEGTFTDFISANGLKWSKSFRISEVPPVSRVRKGLQAESLKIWVDTFGWDRLHFVFFDDLEKKPTHVAQGIYSWLEVDNEFVPQVVHTQKGGQPRSKILMRLMNMPKGQIKRFFPRILREKIRSRVYKAILKQPKIDPEIQAMLDEYYASDIQLLSEMTGRDLSHWLKRDAA